MSDTIELKAVNVLNDFIAVMRVIDIPDGVLVDEAAMEKISNEGIVVGVGPEAVIAGTQQPVVGVGDRVIFRPVKYLEMKPQSGGYEGKSVLIVRKSDLLVRIGVSTKYVIMPPEISETRHDS